YTLASRPGIRFRHLDRERQRPQEPIWLERCGVPNLRNAGHAGVADLAAKFQLRRIGVGIGEVRIRLTGEKPAQGAISIAQPRRETVGRAELVDAARRKDAAASEIEFDEGPRLAIRGRGAGLDIELRLLRR